MNYKEDELVDKVLQMVVGKDKHALHGHIECDSPEMQHGLESLAYGLIRNSESEIDLALKTIRYTMKISIETWEEDYIQEPVDPALDPEAC